ncbi:hypothetical protein GRX01_06950 [Halobaculum sp. WSA2]|uniref:DUF7313 domain-containing protein n=1 Tax=Halobaculum saliterrae TaxID=2073113 RepID=A0A6B0STX9_9EURY|nr:hypothetical protein [Halobaculum saliterrae]MXR41076.1 hypothetical protein [Halobaculum saliterrae]
MLASPLEFLVPLGALESVAGVLPYVILVVVLVNVVTRLLAQRSFERAAAEGDDDDALSRYLPHEIVNVLLVLLSFAFMVVEPHGGMVLSVLVIGMVISDFFEYESRRVEARNNLEMDKPNSAIVASVLVIAYAGYQALFFVIEPLWSSIV